LSTTGQNHPPNRMLSNQGNQPKMVRSNEEGTLQEINF